MKEILSPEVVAEDDLEVLLHELKQPLFSAGIVAERLEDFAAKILVDATPAPEQLGRDVRVLVTSLQQLKEIIDTYATMDDVEWVCEHWSERFESQIEAIESITRARSVDFSFECSVESRQDGPNLGAIGHILRNLSMNAILAAIENRDERKPFVLVQLMNGKDNSIVLSVHDSGKGIREDVRKRIFERGVSTRLNSGGSGYGLWVCRKLATALGGHIDVEVSSLCEGACFVVIIPLRPANSLASTAA
jgi:signal transduction histidine kinase